VETGDLGSAGGGGGGGGEASGVWPFGGRRGKGNQGLSGCCLCALLTSDSEAAKSVSVVGKRNPHRPVRRRTLAVARLIGHPGLSTLVLSRLSRRIHVMFLNFVCI
jgi:hypothetical protein